MNIWCKLSSVASSWSKSLHMNHQNFWPSLERVPINEEKLNVKYEDVSMFDGVLCCIWQYWMPSSDTILSRWTRCLLKEWMHIKEEQAEYHECKYILTFMIFSLFACAMVREYLPTCGLKGIQKLSWIGKRKKLLKKNNFSNFSCMFLNPNNFFPILILIALIYLTFETSRNNFKKHSATKIVLIFHCSNELF